MSAPVAPQPSASAVTGVSVDTSRLKNGANLDKAGERFEALFTGMMLASMRKAKLADGLFESKAGDQFRDMWDQKTAENMAAHTPIGIGKAMTEFLARGMGDASADASAGGGANGGTDRSATP